MLAGLNPPPPRRGKHFFKVSLLLGGTHFQTWAEQDNTELSFLSKERPPRQKPNLETPTDKSEV